MGEPIKLNIGGVKYWTTAETLLKYAGDDSFFSSLLSGRVPVKKDAKGFIFIDANGKRFEPILDYMRTGVWRYVNTAPLSIILQPSNQMPTKNA